MTFSDVYSCNHSFIHSLRSSISVLSLSVIAIASVKSLVSVITLRHVLHTANSNVQLAPSNVQLAPWSIHPLPFQTHPLPFQTQLLPFQIHPLPSTTRKKRDKKKKTNFQPLTANGATEQLSGSQCTATQKQTSKLACRMYLGTALRLQRKRVLRASWR